MKALLHQGLICPKENVCTKDIFAREVTFAREWKNKTHKEKKKLRTEGKCWGLGVKVIEKDTLVKFKYHYDKNIFFILVIYIHCVFYKPHSSKMVLIYIL